MRLCSIGDCDFHMISINRLRFVDRMIITITKRNVIVLLYEKHNKLFVYLWLNFFFIKSFLFGSKIKQEFLILFSDVKKDDNCLF